MVSLSVELLEGWTNKFLLFLFSSLFLVFFLFFFSLDFELKLMFAHNFKFSLILNRFLLKSGLLEIYLWLILI